MKISKILKRSSLSLAVHESTKSKGSFEKPKSFPGIWAKILYKEYPRYPRILLPTNRIERKDIYQVLLKRESVRKFGKKEISLKDISTLLFFSAGVKSTEKRRSLSKRMYPSGGALYPLEAYVIAKKTSVELKAGLYHYNVKYHALELMRKGNFSKILSEIAGDVNKTVVGTCSLLLVVTAVFGRTEVKYGKSAYRLMLLEAGHLGQNVYLISTALGLSACAIGGFAEDKMNKLLDLDIEKEQAIYVACVGKTVV